jgi:predicted GIY-YIG superfamily endonuclease
MRISNAAPDLTEDEVFQVFVLNCKKALLFEKIASIPVGKKYAAYSTSILERLKVVFPGVEATLQYQNDIQYVCRIDLSNVHSVKIENKAPPENEYTMAMTSIYIIRLEGGRYYIGKSDNIIQRYQQHLSGQGSAWTRKYAPISLERTIENVSPFEEDKVTKEYMAKYGIDKVRGGSYVEIELSDFHKEALNMEIWAAKGHCTQCGRTGHFVKDCYAKTDASGNKIMYEDDTSDEDSSDDDTCFRCGREGHWSTECYASRDIRGRRLS